MAFLKIQDNGVMGKLDEIFEVFSSVRKKTLVEYMGYALKVKHPWAILESYIDNTSREIVKFGGADCVKKNPRVTPTQEELDVFDACLQLRMILKDDKTTLNIAKGISPYAVIYKNSDRLYGFIPYTTSILADVLKHNLMDKKWFSNAYIEGNVKAFAPVIVTTGGYDLEKVKALPIEGEYYWGRIEVRHKNGIYSISRKVKAVPHEEV